MLAVRLTWTSEPLVQPDSGEKIVGGERLADLSRMMLSAAMRSGLSQMRMAKVRPPRMSAFCTPSRAVRRGWTTRTR